MIKNNLFSKITLSIALLLGFTIFVHADRTANGVPGDGVIGQVLQSLGGSESIWAATSSLGIIGGGGSGNSAWTIGNGVIYNATSSDNVGIGTTTPSQKLQVFGGFRLNGGLFDSVNASGTLGMILKSTGTSTLWVATSSLGFTGGSSFFATTSINGWATTTFTFATSSDTNIGLNITTSTSAVTFTPTWIGTLADARITSSASWNAASASTTALTPAYIKSQITGTYPIIVTSGVVSTGFSTSTTNNYTGVNTFTAQTNLANASATGITVSNLYATGTVAVATTTINGDLTLNGTFINRVVGYSSSASTTINIGTTDIATTTITATTTFVNPTGTPKDGQMFEIRAKATTTHGLFFDTSFASSTDLNNINQIASGTTRWLFEYRQDVAKWELVGLLKNYIN